jgi:hypothetical protein
MKWKSLLIPPVFPTHASPFGWQTPSQHIPDADACLLALLFRHKTHHSPSPATRQTDAGGAEAAKQAGIYAPSLHFATLTMSDIAGNSCLSAPPVRMCSQMGME